MAVLKPGLRLKSAVCDGEAMIVKAIDVTLTCGGVPMLAAGEEAQGSGQANPEHMFECLIGKRYINADETLEVLCVKGGKGLLRIRRRDANGQGNQKTTFIGLTS